MMKKENIKNLIINDDFFIAVKQIPDETFDLIFVDPPYWMRTDKELVRVEGKIFDGVSDQWDVFSSEEEYNKFTLNWLTECRRVLKPNGSIWIISGMQNVYTVGGLMQQLGFWIINDVIWHKTNPTPNFKGTRLTNSHETLIWATKSKKSKYCFNYKTAKELNTDSLSEIDLANGIRKQLGSVWRIPIAQGNERLRDNEGKKVHSTQKPEKLLQRIIAISSKMQDVIFDPFSGTMTTGKVAKEMGRYYCMIERDNKYFHYGSERIKNTVVNINDIASASFDKKPIHVTLSQMINDKFLITGERFYLKDGIENNVFLQSDGKLQIGNNFFNIHDAVGEINGNGIKKNGFDYWFVKRKDQLVSINDIRNSYRELIQNHNN